MNYLKKPSEFNKAPVVEVKNEDYKVVNGWDEIVAELNAAVNSIKKTKKIVVIETYQGVIHEELISNLEHGLAHTCFIQAS